jgi:hypothetical protein
LNTFVNLFTSADQVMGNALFGLPAGLGPADFSYRGPYLAADMAGKSDPWGNAYLILGYNATSAANDGPIWVVCAGRSGTINPVNLIPVGGRYPEAWNHGGASATNIAIRVH